MGWGVGRVGEGEGASKGPCESPAPTAPWIFLTNEKTGPSGGFAGLWNRLRCTFIGMFFGT